MDHPVNGIADLVTGIILLLLIAAITTIASKKFDRLPLTIALVFVGILISALADYLPGFETISHFTLTPELVLFVFIPTLIFESAYNLDARQVARNILPILTLAVPGLLLSTAIIGVIMHLLTPFDFMVALLIGAILSATDPVAVVAIFKQLGVPERLLVLVEGESLFNDATSLVLATLLIGILAAGEFSSATVIGGFGEFLFVFIGGVAVGWVLALLAGQTLGEVESDPAIEITLTTILAYCSFIVAEHVFHVSGIMAVVAAGLTIGSWGKSKISPSTEEFMEHFWEYLAYLANALIFLMVGLQIDLVTLWQSVDLIAAVVAAMLVSRLVVIFLLAPLVGKMPGNEAIGIPFQQVMYWGGLRGAIALAIVLSLPDFQYKDTLIAVVMGAVLFTLVVQGLTIETLVKWLGLNKLSVPDNLARMEGDRNARQEGLSRLSSLVSGGMFSERIADNIRDRCERELEELEEELATLNAGMGLDEQRQILIMRCLVREKARFEELFGRGLINEWAYRELNHTSDVQLDDARHGLALPTAKIEISIGKAIGIWITGLADRLPGFGRVAEQFRTQRIIREYDVTWGRFRSSNSVLSGLDELAGDGAIDKSVVDEVLLAYEEIQTKTRTSLDEMSDLYPEFVEAIQEQLGQRLLVITEHESVEHAAQLGMIHEGIASTILKDQNERIRQLKRDDLTACFEISVDELLRKVTLFEGMADDQFDQVAQHLRRRTVPRGVDIIRQGALGDAMFLIARGVANVSISSEGVIRQVATLYAGDLFGESALLNQSPRNATITAATPCSLYVLRSQDLDRICSAHPQIRELVEGVDQQRRNENTTRSRSESD